MRLGRARRLIVRLVLGSASLLWVAAVMPAAIDPQEANRKRTGPTCRLSDCDRHLLGAHGHPITLPEVREGQRRALLFRRRMGTERRRAMHVASGDILDGLTARSKATFSNGLTRRPP